MIADHSHPIHWPSAVRARTVLAVCHGVWCEPAGVEPGIPVCAGLLEVAGVPHLLPPAQPTWMAAGLELSCTAVLDELGLVRLTGLALACLTPDGVTTVQVPFDPPVEQPADLWRRLAERWGGSGVDSHHT